VTASRTLRFASAGIDDLRVIREFVRRTARDLGSDDECSDALVQAVDESATNVLRHGYGGREGPLDVAIERRAEWVVIALRDEAPVFDPTTWPEPDIALPLVQRVPGGHGIHLMRASVDRVEHSADGKRGNTLTLSRRLSGAQEGNAG
jgi:serine/threonine-protein kinase RsbW